MNITEARKIIAKSPSAEWFNSIEIEINYPYLDVTKTLKGIVSIYRFLSQQVKGWEKYEDLPKELSTSYNYFNSMKLRIENFISGNSEKDNHFLVQHWENERRSLVSSSNIFTFDSEETKFLINVYRNFPRSFISAYHFILGVQFNTNVIGSKDGFIGALLAFELYSKDKLDINERRKKERISLNRLKTDFQNFLTKVDIDLDKHFLETNSKFSEYSKLIDETKESKEKLFDEWFDNSSSSFDNFNEQSAKNIEKLEDTYRKKLELEAPADYWKSRGEKLQSQGWWALVVLLIALGIVTFSLGEILWNAPEQIYTSFLDKDKSAAIRWSIVYITLISFMAFGIRAITKVMFSSFHLARDAQERYTLTIFYLSLTKGSNVDDKERNLIMQSLFSRSDTGLLKEDSAPTMPNDIIGKLFNK